jgi:hypothetical protein
MPALMARSRRFESTGQTSRPVFAGFSANLLGEVGGVSRTAKHGRTAHECSPEEGDRSDPQTLSRGPCDL